MLIEPNEFFPEGETELQITNGSIDHIEEEPSKKYEISISHKLKIEPYEFNWTKTKK